MENISKKDIIDNIIKAILVSWPVRHTHEKEIKRLQKYRPTLWRWVKLLYMLDNWFVSPYSWDELNKD